MGHLSYEEGKKVVLKGLILLGIITLLEVGVALLGKGYLVHGFHLPTSIMYLAMISMSLYKAYFIVYEFMHMRYEAPGLVKSVLLPTLLLVWAVIAFFYEGRTWHNNRGRVNDKEIAISNTASSHDHNSQDMHGVNEMKTEEHKAQPAENAASQTEIKTNSNEAAATKPTVESSGAAKEVKKEEHK